MPNPFYLSQIREETFVDELSFHDSLESTNSFAIERLRDGDARLPLLVLTPKQTRGRGRGCNEWWSSEGALTFTLVLDSTGLDNSTICKMSLTIGLAVCQSLERFAPAGDLALKWPNDVYLEGRKVCGVLIERPSDWENRVVIGIGINVNNSLKDAPQQLKTIAISLIDCLEEECDLTSVLIECLKQIERRVKQLRTGDRSLLDQWQAYCLLTGRQVCIDNYANEIPGICHGIDEDGALLVKSGDRIHRCVGGVVRLK